VLPIYNNVSLATKSLSEHCTQLISGKSVKPNFVVDRKSYFHLNREQR